MMPSRTPNRPPPALSRAALSGALIRLPVRRDTLEAWLARRGPLRLAPSAKGASGTHFVHCELWAVHDGELRMGRAGQHDLLSLLGSAEGAIAGGALSAFVGALSGIGMAPRDQGRRWVTAVGHGVAQGQATGRSLGRALSRAIASQLGNYRECMISIPGVLFRRDTVPNALVCGMFTDSAIARWADAALGYGYGKRVAHFDVDSPVGWAIRDVDGLVLSFRGEPRPRRPVSAAALRGVEEALAMPLLGVTPSGTFARSRLERSMAAASEVTSVTGVVQLRPGTIPAGLARYEAPRQCTSVSPRVITFSGMYATVGYPRPVA